MKAVPLKRPHEHEFEPQRGLPERLPEGERILWQGAPDWQTLALRAYHWRKLAIYFALLLLWQVASNWDSAATPAQAFAGWLYSAPVFALVLAVVAWWSWMSASTTCYTITDKRVVMRMGIVLGITFNLPFTRIAGADLGLPSGDAVGDVSLQLKPEDRMPLFQLWPHARPWAWARVQPTLRCVPAAAEVAQLLTQAWLQAAQARQQASTVRQPQRGDAPAGSGQLVHG